MKKQNGVNKNPQPTTTKARVLAAQHIQAKAQLTYANPQRFKLKRFANVESKIPNYGKMQLARSDANLMDKNKLSPLEGGSLTVEDK